MVDVNSLECTFGIGDTVVYAKHGVGVVEDINEMEFRGDIYYSYKISMKASGIYLFVPIEEAEEMGLRHLRSEDDLDKAFDILSSEEEVLELAKTKTWKERKKVLDDMFSIGCPINLAKIVKYLYAKNKIKDLPNSERKIYDFSLKYFIHELAVVKGVTDTEADNLIAECLCDI